MKRLPLLGLILLTVWAYWPTLSNGFVYEDFHYLSSLTGYSPEYLPTASALWNLQIRWDMPTWSYHALNLSVHLVNGLLLWALLRRLIASETAVLMAVGVFWLHPLQTEAVAYISGRTELVGLCWALIGLLVWAWDEELTWLRAGVVVVATWLAVVNRPTLAVLLFMYATLWKRRPVSQAVAVITLMGAWCGADVLVRYLLRYPPSWAESESLRTHLVHLVAWARYTLMLVVPEGQSVDHDWSWVDTESCLLVLSSVVCLAVLVGVMRRYVPRLVQVGLVWMVLPVLPRMVLRLGEVFNEHQHAETFLGISLVIAGGIDAWASTRPSALCAADATSPAPSLTSGFVPSPAGWGTPFGGGSD